MRGRSVRMLAGAALGLLLLVWLGRIVAGLYTELLWFEQVGYANVYRTRLLSTIAIRLGATTVGAALVLANLWLVIRQLGPVHVRRRYGDLEIAEQIQRSSILAGIILLSVLTGVWLSGTIFTATGMLGILAWLNHDAWGVIEPLFERDVAFYVFSLPVLRRALGFVTIVVAWSAVLVTSGYLLVGAVRWQERRLTVERGARLHLAALVATIVALLALRYWLGRYDLVLRGGGVQDMVGYTDVHVRLPARAFITLGALALAGSLMLGAHRRSLLPPAAAAGVFLLLLLGGAWLYPSFVQTVRVEPNELAREAPYIRWHLEYTSRAHDLDRIRREQLPFMPRAIGGWAELRTALERLPLWDREPLQVAFNQTEARRGYYHFPDVDYDRYGPAGDVRQVAIAVREFRRDGLPPAAQTWQTLRLNPAFVRGIGAVVTPAAGTRADPELWISEIDPVQRAADAPAELEIVEPSVYFGETMNDYIVLGTAAGNGAGTPAQVASPAGVPLDSFRRVLAFAVRFRDRNLLFAGELTRESRLVFRRGVRERVAQLAPFVYWDPDPYPIVHDGRIVWLLDGYSATSSYPLAQPYVLDGVGRLRYARNSVKATVDAVTGATVLYAIDPEDPILRSYMRAFPGLVRSGADMPEALRRHKRYPALLLRMQAEILKTHHLDRPEPFYAGQESWELPGERGAQGVDRPYRPLYMVTQLPGSAAAEYVALLPFIARARQTMTALLIARNDPPHYGELLLLELPRDQQVRGPTLIHSLVQQDPVIARDLSLWRQTGEVHLGQLRVVPLESSILYVQPLFLSAFGPNPTPQLQSVIVSDGTRVRMAPTLSAAIDALASDTEPIESRAAASPDAVGAAWAQQALQLLEEAQRLLQAGDFAGFGARWTELQRLLRRAASE